MMVKLHAKEKSFKASQGNKEKKSKDSHNCDKKGRVGLAQLDKFIRRPQQNGSTIAFSARN